MSKTKLFFIFIPVLIILLTVSIFMVFYSIPYIKSNELLIAANKVQSISSDDGFISLENFKKLCVVDDYVSEYEYIQLNTQKKVKLIDWKTVDLICSLKATVYSYDNMEYLRDYSKDLTIRFVFKDNQWSVKSVE